MRNYKDSDYARNKYSKGIVYKFANETIEITLQEYLSSNSNHTKEDFDALKALSDDIFLEQVRHENKHNRKNVPITDCNENAVPSDTSAEEMYIAEVDLVNSLHNHKQKLDIANTALSKLTAVQLRRYTMYHVDGLTMREIAEKEGGGSHNKVQKSLILADKKIKKFLNS